MPLLHGASWDLGLRGMLNGRTNVNTIASKYFEFEAPHRCPTSFLTRNTCCWHAVLIVYDEKMKAKSLYCAGLRSHVVVPTHLLTM